MFLKIKKNKNYHSKLVVKYEPNDNFFLENLHCQHFEIKFDIIFIHYKYQKYFILE